MPERTRGFTLVEMAIVLVVIGLIVGGVLVGTDLIKASEIRATVSQIEQYTAAAATFRTKYNCIPGDCPKAVAFGLGTVNGAGDNGNGDGMLKQNGSGSPYFTNYEERESLNFWYHLSQSGILPGNWLGSVGWTTWTSDNTALFNPLSSYLPITKAGGAKGVVIPYTLDAQFYGTDNLVGNSFALVAPDMTMSPGYFRQPFTSPECLSIDTKIDDGKPCTGSVVPSRSEWRILSPQCSASSTYNVSSNVINCGLIVAKVF